MKKVLKKAKINQNDGALLGGLDIGFGCICWYTCPCGAVGANKYKSDQSLQMDEAVRVRGF